ncbi:MAG: hypothetical protein U0359_30950 [Byssovorax sp.]
MSAIDNLFSGRFGVAMILAAGLTGCAGAEVGEPGDVGDEGDVAAAEGALFASSTIVYGHLKAMDQGAPLAGVNVRACSSRDFACTAPASADQTQKDGAFKLLVPLSTNTLAWDGYFDFSGGTAVSSIVYPSSSVSGATYDFSAPLPTGTMLDDAMDALGVKPDPRAGNLMVGGDSCDSCSGVSIGLEGLGRAMVWYTDDGVMSSGVSKTSKDGLAGIMNVPEGSWTLQIKDAATGELLAKKSIIIRGRTLTLVPMSFAH